MKHPYLSREQSLQFEAAAGFARDHLPSDDTAGFDREAWAACAGFGIQRSRLGKEWGGDALDVATTVARLEGLGFGCRNNGLTLALNVHVWCIQETLVQFGSAEIQARYLPGLGDGSCIGAYALSERDAGSDAFSLQTRAVARDGVYVLNGEKSCIGLAPDAEVVLVFARTDPEAGNWGLSAFLVERDTRGVEVVGPRHAMGLQGTSLGDVILRDCEVPAANLVGTEGGGLLVVTYSMELERSFLLSSHVGAMAAQLDRCVEHVTGRKQFGQPIGAFQAVSHRLADMRLRLEQARAMLYHTAHLKDQQTDIGLESAMTNLCISENVVRNSEDAMRLHGAKGYLREYGVERDLRDALGGVIYSGTSDIQRSIIARYLGL